MTDDEWQASDEPDLDDAEIAGRLLDILGAKLTAYLASANTRKVHAWAEGTETMPEEVAKRLRLAYRVAAEVTHYDGREVAQAWFMGMNPELDDWSPARLIREKDQADVRDRILRAARRFIAD